MFGFFFHSLDIRLNDDALNEDAAIEQCGRLISLKSGIDKYDRRPFGAPELYAPARSAGLVVRHETSRYCSTPTGVMMAIPNPSGARNVCLFLLTANLNPKAATAFATALIEVVTDESVLSVISRSKDAQVLRSCLIKVSHEVLAKSRSRKIAS